MAFKYDQMKGHTLFLREIITTVIQCAFLIIVFIAGKCSSGEGIRPVDLEKLLLEFLIFNIV